MQTHHAALRLEVLADVIEGTGPDVVEPKFSEDDSVAPSEKPAEQAPEVPKTEGNQLDLQALKQKLRGKRPTVTQLMAILHAKGLVDRPYTMKDIAKDKSPKGWSNETYGRNSMLYLFSKADSPELAKVKQALTQMGIKFNTNWNDGKGIEVPVAYFKGWHWNE